MTQYARKGTDCQCNRDIAFSEKDAEECLRDTNEGLKDTKKGQNPWASPKKIGTGQRDTKKGQK